MRVFFFRIGQRRCNFLGAATRRLVDDENSQHYHHYYEKNYGESINKVSGSGERCWGQR